jgi:LPS-assembly protein
MAIGRSLSLAFLIGGLLVAMPLHAVEKTSPQPAKSSSTEEPKPLVIDADELVYDRDNERVSASGNVKLYYKGKILEADIVTYDQKTKRVTASGHAKLTEPGGDVAYGETFELSDDFRDGFIKSLRIDTIDKTHFVSPRAERIGSDVLVFEKGTYTACDACKEDPAKPAFWQIKAKRIIHNKTEQMIYYEDARFELLGVPVFYSPYLSAPDPDVKKKTGLLFVSPGYSSTFGASLSGSYFINLAPDYDLTLSPSYFSRQGFLGALEWRQLLDGGSYTLRVAGISQENPGEFLTGDNGPGDMIERGYIETFGKMAINKNWYWGWDIALISDKWFLENYKIDSPSVTNLGTIKYESTSTAFLQGDGDRSYFNMSGYSFKTLVSGDNQTYQPYILPVLDYDRRFSGPSGIEGEFDLTANFLHLTREEADYGTLTGTCNSLLPTSTNCYLRGVGGNYARYTTQLAWRRTFIDDLGQSWTPFSSARLDFAFSTLSSSSTANQQQDALISNTDEPLSRTMGTVGVTYRYPFISPGEHITQQFEPIVQLIARPNETNTGKFPNEDAQSLVFDDTNLFSVDKFSGYDRIEGGVRANIGGQYTLNLNNGAYANLLLGQSFHLSGSNSFASRGLALEGLQSGLDTNQSDYISRLQLVPTQDYSFTARARFDENDLTTKRLELETRATFDKLSTSLNYAFFAAQPDAGIAENRDGLGVGSSYKIDENWNVFGNALFYLAKDTVYSTNLAYYGMGFGYNNECTTFALSYNSREELLTGTEEGEQTLWLSITFRTLGAFQFEQRSTASTGTSN